MNYIELRYRSRRFSESMSTTSTVIQYLRDIYELDNELFLWELYKQLLNREPDQPGFASHLSLLNNGHTRSYIVSDIINSKEAQHLYQSPALTAPHGYSIIQVLHAARRLHPETFVTRLYEQLLNRRPQQGELRIHMNMLVKMSRWRLVTSLIHTPECQRLLAGLKPSAVPQTPVHARQIGIFLGFSQQVTLGGEGIGRYTVRLAEGLLQHDDQTMVHVFAMAHNMDEVLSTFQYFMHKYPNRLFFGAFPDAGWLNRHAPVDAWIIPYIGLELAEQLERPNIVVLHDLVYVHFYDVYIRKQPEFLHYLDPIVKALAAKAARVVCSSNFIRDHEGLQYLKLPADKVKVIRLAAPSAEYDAAGIPDEQAFRSKYQLHTSYITFPSAIRLHKNHLRLIEAFLNYKQSPDGHDSDLALVFTDRFDDNPLRPEYEALLKRYYPGTLNSVVFLGRIPFSHLPALYKYAIGTIVPTEFEGSCPFPILESLSVGTPVAISRINVALEVIEDLSSFITFHPHLVPEIQWAIHQLRVRHAELPDRQRAAISGALNRTWKDAAAEFIELIDSL
ncbi:DUF4214 domain-containing protein [Paenibacillus protaetiae]|nr:DUF4214 domain-containing protein [Paenibacillus protaetiae]